MSIALVILSGGQDSTTCLFLAKQVHDKVHAVTFDYGQRHSIEIQAAKKVAQLAGVASHEIITLPAGVLKSTSPLVSENELELYASYGQMDAIIGDRVEKTFVPMRNMLFLTIAANRAVDLGAKRIYTGVCQQDNANYPDCRQTFIRFCENAIAEGLGRLAGFDINIETPLMHLTKADTVKLAYSMPDCWKALAYTHTSYDGKYPPIDMNHSNVLRAQGFLEAGLPDPLVVRAWREGLMPLPDTSNYAEFKEDNL